jgi:hypothetical protein
MDDVWERLERLAEEGTPRGATAVMRGARQSLLVEPREVPRAKTEWGGRSMLLVAGVVLLVVVVVASVLVVTRDTSPSSRVLPVISDTATYRDLYDTTDQPASGPLYVIPDFVPAGFSVLRVDDSSPTGSGGGSPEVDRMDGWARLDAAGERVVESFTLQWGPGVPSLSGQPGFPDSAQTTDPLAGFRSQGTPTTVRGHDGLEGTNPQIHFVAWEEPPGQMVALTSSTVSSSDLLGVAESLGTRPDGGFEVTRAPEGFVQVTSQPGVASSGSASRDVMYRDVTGRGFRVHVDDDSEQPPGTALLSNIGDPTLIAFAGHHAVVSSQLNAGLTYDQQSSFLQAADQYVQWLAPANTRVTVAGLGLSEAEVLAIAQGMRTVDRTGWEQFLVQAPGRVGAPPADLSVPEPEFTGDEAAIADVFRTWVSRPDVDTTVSILEDGEALRDTIDQVRTRNPGSENHSARVDAVRLVDDTHALVTFSILTGESLTLGNQQGAAVKIDGTWHVSRATYCATVSLGAVSCPPG